MMMMMMTLFGCDNSSKYKKSIGSSGHKDAAGLLDETLNRSLYCTHVYVNAARCKHIHYASRNDGGKEKKFSWTKSLSQA